MRRKGQEEEKLGFVSLPQMSENVFLLQSKNNVWPFLPNYLVYFFFS